MTQHLVHNGLPNGLTRWQFFGLIQTARRQLGLSKGAISYLKVAVSHTLEEDYLSGRICSFWTSVTKIATRAEIDRRQVARIEAELAAKGWLIKTASDHSSRCGSRRNGRIYHEFGINLAPLIERATEVQAAARKAVFEEAEEERLRLRIRKLFGQIRKHCAANAMEAAEEVLPNRRPSTIQSFERLKQVAEALEAVWEDFSTPNSIGGMSHQKDISPTPNTHKGKKYKICRAREENALQQVRTQPAQVTLLASKPLQDLIHNYWKETDGGGPPSWQSVQMAARDRADQLGIKSDVWHRQCNILGPDRAALCLMIADRNAERTDGYRVRKTAAAAFVGLARSEARQEAVVGSLLGELMVYVGGHRYAP